jgi:hypothetical protein
MNLDFSHLPACQRHQHGNRMLRRGDGIAKGRVHDHNARSRGGGNIHVINADARAADDFQVLRALQDIGGDFGGRADRQTVVIVDDLGQFFGLQVGAHGDLHAAAGEDLFRLRAHFIADQDFGGLDGLGRHGGTLLG